MSRAIFLPTTTMPYDDNQQQHGNTGILDAFTSDEQMTDTGTYGGQQNQGRQRSSSRGFAAMDKNQQRQIASLGGQASGGNFAKDKDRARVAGRRGGQAVSRNREYMAAIGRKGGQAVSRDRNHMAEIGRKGGRA